MVQKSGVHQLRLVEFPMICRVLAPSQTVVVGVGIPINSTASKSDRGPTAKGEHGSRSFASGESIGTGAKNESHLPQKNLS